MTSLVESQIKMLALNVSCPVCKVSFRDSDAIYSTSCGHIFHFFCMNQWRSKSSTCPQCRSYNPTTHSIYLNFEGTHEYATIVNDLRAKLQSSDAEMKQIKEKLVNKDQKIDELKRLYNISEQWRAELEHKIHKLSHELQVQNVNHTKELSLKVNEIDSLKTLIETMRREEDVYELCEKYAKIEEELKLATSRFNAENSKLKENLSESESSKMILNHKLEMQEQRLKHVTLELKKQIEQSINRSMENLTTSSAAQTLQKLKMAGNKKRQTASSKQTLTEQISNTPNTVGDHEDFLQSPDKIIPAPQQNKDKKKQNNHTAASTKVNIKRTRHFVLAQPYDRKVIIKDIPSIDLAHPLKNSVILLASKMSMTLKSEDISSVSIVEQKGLTMKHSDTVSLLVEFNSIDGKIQFLMNRNRLKFNSSTKAIQIKEYIDEAIYPVFMYANRNLRANGYEYIACKDNQVFAKKNRHDTAEISIRNRSDVDRLLGRPITQNHIRPSISQNRFRHSISQNRISHTLFDDDLFLDDWSWD